MKHLYALLFFLLTYWSAYAQLNELYGLLSDENAKPLPYATVSLINPGDSTMEYFSVTNSSGVWQIKNVKHGEYIFQVACLGYNTINKNISVPSGCESLKRLLMSPKTILLGAAQVSAEHIPMLIRGDTVEYNASAFKNNPGDVAENLLKKLPGVEVDQNGNVKAMGEGVNNVLVDGKEFFGNDPKVATKNLPAESIDKIQVYDKASEESALSGIEDADHDKTMNIILKNGQKKAWFGEIASGGGDKKHYAATGKIFRFTKKQQTACLGMLNNINKAGFSLQEYITFNGGLSSMISNGGLQINANDNLPVDMGENARGLLKSFAGALNYSYELKKGKRISGSYIGNSVRQQLTEDINTNYFLPDSEEKSHSSEDASNNNYAHRWNLGYNNRSDSTQVFLLSAKALFSDQSNHSDQQLYNFSGSEAISSVLQWDKNQSIKLSSDISGTWMKKYRGNFRLLKLGFAGQSICQSYETNRVGIMSFFNPALSMSEELFREDQSLSHNYQLSVSGLTYLGRKVYLESKIGFSTDFSSESRTQEDNFNSSENLDSLYYRNTLFYNTFLPEFTLKKNNHKFKTEISLLAKAGVRTMNLWETENQSNSFFFLLPSAQIEYSLKTGHRLSFQYVSDINKVTADKISTTQDKISPVLVWYGSPLLKDEQDHRVNLFWMLFDQFSQVSAFVMATGTCTFNKIGFERTINDSLFQTIRLVNTGKASNLSASADFSKPFRTLGIVAGLSYRILFANETGKVNGIVNELLSTTHSASVTINKKKKEKLQISAGFDISATKINYSIQRILNSSYLDYNIFGELRWTPSSRWVFATKGNFKTYTGSKFGDPVFIPLVNASCSYSFLKANKATLSIEIFDVFNKNKGIIRVGEQNYLREIRNNTLGRFVMLTLRYRLNKIGNTDDGLIINTRN